MNLSISAYKNQAQSPSAISSLLNDGTKLFIAFATGAACATSPTPSQYDNHVLLPEWSSLNKRFDGLTSKCWTQSYATNLPTDADFSNVAIDLVDRQRNAPRAIDEIIALHMADLYD